MMDASLDTDIVIHLYKSGKKNLLFSSFNKLYIYDYLVEVELKNKSLTVYKDLINDIKNDSITLVKNKQGHIHFI